MWNTVSHKIVGKAMTQATSHKNEKSKKWDFFLLYLVAATAKLLPLGCRRQAAAAAAPSPSCSRYILVGKTLQTPCFFETRLWWPTQLPSTASEQWFIHIWIHEQTLNWILHL
jgi:hypothetical protein